MSVKSSTSSNPLVLNSVDFTRKVNCTRPLEVFESCISTAFDTSVLATRGFQKTIFADSRGSSENLLHEIFESEKQETREIDWSSVTFGNQSTQVPVFTSGFILRVRTDARLRDRIGEQLLAEGSAPTSFISKKFRLDNREGFFGQLNTLSECFVTGSSQYEICNPTLQLIKGNLAVEQSPLYTYFVHLNIGTPPPESYIRIAVIPFSKAEVLLKNILTAWKNHYNEKFYCNPFLHDKIQVRQSNVDSLLKALQLKNQIVQLKPGEGVLVPPGNVVIVYSSVRADQKSTSGTPLARFSFVDPESVRLVGDKNFWKDGDAVEALGLEKHSLQRKDKNRSVPFFFAHNQECGDKYLQSLISDQERKQLYRILLNKRSSLPPTPAGSVCGDEEDYSQEYCRAYINNNCQQYNPEQAIVSPYSPQLSTYTANGFGVPTYTPTDINLLPALNTELLQQHNLTLIQQQGEIAIFRETETISEEQRQSEEAAEAARNIPLSFGSSFDIVSEAVQQSIDFDIFDNEFAPQTYVPPQETRIVDNEMSCQSPSREELDGAYLSNSRSREEVEENESSDEGSEESGSSDEETISKSASMLERLIEAPCEKTKQLLKRQDELEKEKQRLEKEEEERKKKKDQKKENHLKQRLEEERKREERKKQQEDSRAERKKYEEEKRRRDDKRRREEKRRDERRRSEERRAEKKRLEQKKMERREEEKKRKRSPEGSNKKRRSIEDCEMQPQMQVEPQTDYEIQVETQTDYEIQVETQTDCDMQVETQPPNDPPLPNDQRDEPPPRPEDDSMPKKIGMKTYLSVVNDKIFQLLQMGSDDEFVCTQTYVGPFYKIIPSTQYAHIRFYKKDMNVGDSPSVISMEMDKSLYSRVEEERCIQSMSKRKNLLQPMVEVYDKIID